MYHNRISHHFDRLSSFVPAAPVAVGVAASASAGMIIVPVTVHPGSWQAQLYRMAYEQARAELAPPRHHTRFFTVWN